MSKRARKTPSDPLEELNSTPPPAAQTPPNRDESAEAQAFLEQSPMPSGSAASKEAPELPETNPLDQTVYDWMRTFTEAEWTRIMCYVYRKRPIFEVDTSDGRPIYAAKFSEPFDEEDLKKVVGSGKYELRFVISPPQGGANRNLRRTDVFLMDLRFPPMLPLGDWLDNPRNAQWKGFRAAIEERELIEAAERRKRLAILDNPQAAQQQQQAAAQEEEMANAAVMEALRDTQRQLNEVSNPERQLKTLSTLAEVLRPPAAPAPPPPQDNGLKEFIGMLKDELKAAREEAAEARRQNFELLKAQTAAPHRKEKSLIEQAKEFGELAALMGYKRANGGDDAENSIWAGIVERALDATPDIIAAFMASPTRPSKPRTIDAEVAEPVQTASKPTDTSTAPEADEQADEDTEQQEVDPNVTEEDKKLLTEFEPLLRQFIPNFIQGLKKAKDNPEEAYVMQRFFLDEYGKSNLMQLKNAFGAEKLAKLCTGDPRLKILLPDYDAVLDFLKKFFDYPRAAQAGSVQ